MVVGPLRQKHSGCAKPAGRRSCRAAWSRDHGLSTGTPKIGESRSKSRRLSVRTFEARALAAALIASASYKAPHLPRVDALESRERHRVQGMRLDQPATSTDESKREVTSAVERSARGERAGS